MSDHEQLDADAVVDVPTKKRKRRDIPEEEQLEIDINLPEPPSKKALRKAKKAKAAKPESKDAESTKVVPVGIVEEKASAAAAHSIWIGNLPFTITKAMLRKHLTTASTSIPDNTITRINLPAPRDAKASKTTLKPQNKGFAYVDFSTAAAFEAAVALSETHLAGRALLIKDAKSFTGRPAKDDADGGKNGTPDAKKQTPTRRVFVGNLGFDVTKAALEQHYATCGGVENVHMATFEDTGKCKGFGWVTFAVEGTKSDGTIVSGEEAAIAAVQGWTKVTKKPGDPDEAQISDIENDAAASSDARKKVKKNAPNKWFVNRMQGRPLRCEFAEDPETRYKKRFGKDKDADTAAGASLNSSGKQARDILGEVASEDMGAVRPKIKSRIAGIQPGAPTDFTKRRGRTNQPPPAAEKVYRTGAIVEAKGQRVTFD